MKLKKQNLSFKRLSFLSLGILTKLRNVLIQPIINRIRYLLDFKARRKRNLWKWLYKEIKYDINSRWNTRHFEKLKKKAMRMHLSQGSRYFVIPTKQNHCIIVNSEWRKRYNKTVPKESQINVAQFLKIVYFMTPSGTNSIKL